MITVHIAAAPDGSRQKCARCGIVLEDYKGVVMTSQQSSMHFWPTGGYIRVDGYCSSLRSQDASEPNEVPCGRPS